MRRRNFIRIGYDLYSHDTLTLIPTQGMLSPMREPNQTHNAQKPLPRSPKRGRIILTILLVVVVLLAGLLYSQRHQIHQFLQALSVPPPQPVHITPLTLPPSTVTPGQLTSADWTMYHANNARTGFVAGVPDPTRLASLWKQPLDGAVYAEPPVVAGQRCL
jgi:hypothetical protein